MQIRCPRSLRSLLLTMLLAAAVAFSPVVMHAQTNAGSHNTAASALVQGTVSSTTGAAAGTFSGLLKVTQFAVQNGQIVATGLLTGTITNLDGTTTAVSQTVTTLVTSAAGSCPILSLTLGPLHLNVLGLVVDLNQVNLNIVAQPGAGNLLGNLLCSVANLLNNGGPLAAIVSDLNAILANL